MTPHINACLTRLAILATTLCAAVQSNAASAEQHIVCPMMIDARSVTVDAPAGWRGGFGPTGTRALDGAQAVFTMTDSLQDAWGELRDPPTINKQGGKIIEVTYPLPEEPEARKWVVCHYGDSLFQAFRLAATTKSCTVSSRRENDQHTRKPVYRVTDITCR